jgi:5-methylcytosine-specific restriction endonuclease McrA
MSLREQEHSFAYYFYKTSTWMRCAKAYKQSKGGLCERCWSKGLITPGKEVHHKIRLTPENINDPAVALNWDNLELLCKNCHMEEHSRTRWRADEMGHVIL